MVAVLVVCTGLFWHLRKPTTAPEAKAPPASDVYFVAQLDGAKTLYNANGACIAPSVDDAQPLGFGFVAVAIKGEWKILKHTGEQLAVGPFEEIHAFSEDLAPACRGKRWGFVGRDFSFAIEPQYDAVSSFGSNVARVENGGKWGLIDKAGKYITQPQYEDIGPMQDGLAAFKQKGRWGFMDGTGKVVVEPTYAKVGAFRESLARVTRDGKWGFVDKTGNIAIPLTYEDARAFHEGLAAVKMDDKWGFISTTGKMVINAQYWDVVHDFSGGIARVERTAPPRQIGPKNYKPPMNIDLQGTPIPLPEGVIQLSFTMDHADEYSEGLSAVTTDSYVFMNDSGKRGYADIRGKWVIQPQNFSAAGSFHDGRALVAQNGKYGFIDRSGKFAIAPDYDLAWDFWKGCALVNKGYEFDEHEQNSPQAKEMTRSAIRILALMGKRPGPQCGKFGIVDVNGRMVLSVEHDWIDALAPSVCGVYGNAECERTEHLDEE